MSVYKDCYNLPCYAINTKFKLSKIRVAWKRYTVMTIEDVKVCEPTMVPGSWTDVILEAIKYLTCQNLLLSEIRLTTTE